MLCQVNETIDTVDRRRSARARSRREHSRHRSGGALGWQRLVKCALRLHHGKRLSQSLVSPALRTSSARTPQRGVARAPIPVDSAWPCPSVGPWRQMAVEARASLCLSSIGRPIRRPLAGSDGAGVCGAFHRVGAFHLREQGRASPRRAATASWRESGRTCPRMAAGNRSVGSAPNRLGGWQWTARW